MPDFVAPQLVSDGAVVIVVFPRELLFPKLLAWPCPRSAVAHTRNFPPLKKSGGRRPAVNTLVGYASPPMTRASRENRTPTFRLRTPPRRLGQHQNLTALKLVRPSSYAITILIAWVLGGDADRDTEQSCRRGPLGFIRSRHLLGRLVLFFFNSESAAAWRGGAVYNALLASA
jgi:hypothetical protein